MTLLLKGPNNHTIKQIRDAIYDGLRAALNALKDSKSCLETHAFSSVSASEAVVPGAGAFEIAAYCALKKHAETVKGRAKLGVQVSSHWQHSKVVLLIPGCSPPVA